MAQRKLGVLSAHRKSMIKNMTADLILHGKIETTEARAKEVRRVAEKMITLGKRGDLTARRQAAASLHNKTIKIDDQNGDAKNTRNTVQYLFETVAPKYADRQGGYTKIIKKTIRRGDGAPLVIIELV